MPKTLTKTKTAFIVDQSSFSRAIAGALRFVPSRPTHPVLANLKLEWSDTTGLLSISSFDLSAGCEYRIAADVMESGAITVPARLVADVVNRLPSEAIAISVDGLQFTIAASCGHYALQGMPAADFPAFPEMSDPTARFQWSPADLAAGLAVHQFASDDVTKQVLTGINLKVAGTSASFAATDGHRLCVVDSVVASDHLDLKRTISGRTAAEMLRVVMAIAGDTESVEMEIDDRTVTLKVEGDGLEVMLLGRVLDGQYPAYEQLIPAQPPHELVCDRKTLVGALERISAIAAAKSSYHVVKFQIASDIKVMADVPDVGSGQESMPAQIVRGNAADAPFDIAFNAPYLIESLKAIATTEVRIEMGTPTSAALIKPLAAKYLTTHLIMPVQIRN